MRRRQTAVAALSLAAPLVALSSRPAYAYNCVNAVLRDPYWSQFAGLIQSGGNAAGVAGSLARHGFAVDETPSLGAIMSWPPGWYGAHWTGHVGLVDATYENGTVLVRHENWNGAPERAHVMAVRPGHRFVHRQRAEEATSAAPPRSATAPVTSDQA
jgi:surface antigen